MHSQHMMMSDHQTVTLETGEGKRLEVKSSNNMLGDKLNMIVGEGLPRDPGVLVSGNVDNIRQAVASSGS